MNQDRGSRTVTESTFRFRYRAAARRFALVGLDAIERDRATGAVLAKSTNFLTGIVITERRRYSEARGGEVTLSSEKAQVAKEKRFIEDVKLGDH